MARKPKEVLEAEGAPLPPSPPSAPSDPPREVPPKVSKALAPVKVAPSGPPGPPPVVKRYKVTLGGKALVDTQITKIKLGKVIDERCYNIESLRQQGIGLELIE